jgi:hypothetical protein
LKTKARSEFSHSENPPALAADATLYTSEFPFELIRYDYLIPPTYDIENEAYARDIADSMEHSGWTGRPLWGMFDEDHDWTDDRSTGDLVPEIELRTGSHRWFALGILQERGTWPANLPVGYVPVVVMRRSEVPPAVWEAWADADWYGMKELGDEGVGPKPIIQLMRAERNPQGKKKGKLHRIGDLVKKTALSSFTEPLSVVSKAGEIVTNPKLLEPTPITFYELWDMSVGAGKRIGVFRDLADCNEKSREYWAKHPMAKLERRSVRSANPKQGGKGKRMRQAVIIPAQGNPRLVTLTKKNVEGFKDARGIFHPIRADEDEYDAGRLSDAREYQRSKSRRKRRR